MGIQILEPFKNYTNLLDLLQSHMKEPRKFTIAIDGCSGSGKSSLSRYLSWQLSVSTIETDLCRKLGVDSLPLEVDLEILKRLIQARHTIDRPVIIEGMSVFKFLKDADVHPDFFIWMRKDDSGISDSYIKRLDIRPKPKFEFVWTYGDD